MAEKNEQLIEALVSSSRAAQMAADRYAAHAKRATREELSEAAGRVMGKKD